MKTLRSTIGRIGIAGLAAGTVLLASCGVTDPEDSTWQDISHFAWPASSQMTYVETKTDQIGSSREEHEISIVPNVFNGRQMYMLFDKKTGISQRIRFLANRDSLIVANDPHFVSLPLLAPLDKGHSWTMTNSDNDVVWQATIIEKLSILQVEGRQYKNVVGVKYESTQADGQHIKFQYYAEDIGLVKTVENIYPSRASADPLNLTWTEQQVLTATTAVQN
jgi:hypothetical protein